MPHGELLTESQRLSFQAPASDEREMVRYYTLSPDDLALINRHRGNPNRLGFAVMLCYLRFPGRILQQSEQPPTALCAFIAEQLGLRRRNSAIMPNAIKRAGSMRLRFRLPLGFGLSPPPCIENSRLGYCRPRSPPIMDRRLWRPCLRNCACAVLSGRRFRPLNG